MSPARGAADGARRGAAAGWDERPRRPLGLTNVALCPVYGVQSDILVPGPEHPRPGPSHARLTSHSTTAIIFGQTLRARRRLTSHHQLPPPSGVARQCTGAAVRGVRARWPVPGRVWRLLNNPRPTGGSRVLPEPAHRDPNTPAISASPQATALTPTHHEAANSALPSALSITLRICREIHRCYDAAVRSPNPSVRRVLGSGEPYVGANRRNSA